MTFKKGRSGNPAGKPKGSGYAKKLRDAIEDDIPEIVASVVTAAKAGDMVAARMLLDRVFPSLKAVQEPITVHGLTNGSLTERAQHVIKSLGQGIISPSDAQLLLSGLTNSAKIAEIDELEKRILRLEEQHQ